MRVRREQATVGMVDLELVQGLGDTDFNHWVAVISRMVVKSAGISSEASDNGHHCRGAGGCVLEGPARRFGFAAERVLGQDHALASDGGRSVIEVDDPIRLLRRHGRRRNGRRGIHRRARRIIRLVGKV